MTTRTGAKSRSRRRRVSVSHIPRDTILFFTGIMGVVYETVFTSTDRVQLLLLFGAMMGLPAFLRADEARSNNTDEEKPTE